MFGENLKELREQRGMSQEELAARLHVVRQTISKWEKNLSAPDSEALTRLAEVFEVSVPELLGAERKTDKVHDETAEQLSRISERFAVRNRRSRRILQIVIIAFGALALIAMLQSVWSWFPV
mgnify:FL=1